MQQSTQRAPRIARAAVPTAALGLALMVTLAGSPTPLSAQVSPQPTPRSPAEESPVERALESRSKGSADAGVVVFEIADFQCPYCATFAATVAPALDERYVEPGHVQWIFVNLPLHSHPLAWHAAEAALCAGAAGDQFWAMHDRLFEQQDEWGADSDPAARFATYAADLGVPAGPYAACTESDQVAPLILQDLGSAISAGITGTPTFIIMKGQEVVERMVGVQSVEEWSQVLDSALGR